MNYTRAELVHGESAMNQMRNAIYHLVRYMKAENVEDVKDRLNRMGKNIALTFSRYWHPEAPLTIKTLDIVLKDIYFTIFKSKIIIELDTTNNILKIIDTKCCLCKYNYPDIDIAGCEIIQGFLPVFIEELNNKILQKDAILLKPKGVSKSKAIGNVHCLQEFLIVQK